MKNKILKQNGKLEIFVPFLIGYHPDPNDFFRPTHKYLKDILNECGFDGEIYLIGTGPFITSYQMIFRYLKFSITSNYGSTIITVGSEITLYGLDNL